MLSRQKFLEKVDQIRNETRWMDKFLDVDLQSISSSSIPELSNLKGIIYLIINMINNKIYIGQSTHCFNRRYGGSWYKYTSNKHLKRSAEKYGSLPFKTIILHNDLDLKMLNYLETYYIVRYNTFNGEFGYNKTLGGDNKMFSLESRKKQSKQKIVGFDEFIVRSRLRYGEEFDYFPETYTRLTEPTDIFHKKCSTRFTQMPLHHIKGKGCLICGPSGPPIKPLDEFLKLVKDAGLYEEFNYDLSTYNGVSEKMLIQHKTCGEWSRKLPSGHLKGDGCSKCTRLTSRKGFEKFVKEAGEIHGGLYVYDKHSYSTVSNKTKISCSLHGEFWQTPNAHLSGKTGCGSCSSLRRIKAKTLPFSEFKRKSYEKYKDEYIYHEESYVNTSTKIKMVHTVCGYEFSARPDLHLNNRGCPKCGSEKCGIPLKRPILKIDLVTGLVLEVFDSMGKAGESVGLSHREISRCCLGKTQSEASFGWRRA